MTTEFVPIQTAIDEYLDLTDAKGRLDKNAMLKTANDIVTKLSSPFQYIHKIALLPIEDYRVSLPGDFQSVIQVAFKLEDTNKCVRRNEIVEWTQKTFDGSGCEYKITLECPKCHKVDCDCNSPEVVIDLDRAWELAHPQFKYAHMKHMYRYGGIVNDGLAVSPYHPEFIIIRYATHNFFNADKHVKGCLNLNSKLLAKCPIEYNLEGNSLNINYREGTILLSYFAVKVDDSGYRYIPNIPEVFEAIKWGIEAQMAYREFKKTKNQLDFQTHTYAESRYQEKFGKAKNKLEMPSFQSWWSFLENNWVKVYPYYDNFQQMNRKRPDKYKIPKV